MSGKDIYTSANKDSENKIVLEKLQIYLKDKQICDTLDNNQTQGRYGTSSDSQYRLLRKEEGSSILKEVLNYKKAALFRQPEIASILKSISESHNKK